MRSLFTPLLAILLCALSLGGCAAQARGHKTRLRPGTVDLRHVNTKERVDRLALFKGSDPRKRRVSKQAHKVFRRYLRDWRHDKSHPVPEALIWNLYLVAHHFDRPLEIVSGFRAKERASSRHRKGVAVDFRVEGVEPKVVWEFCKTRFKGVGLGYYPTSRFVHMDVRPKSYYWIDDSGPGEEAQYREGVSQRRPKPVKKRSAKPARKRSTKPARRRSTKPARKRSAAGRSGKEGSAPAPSASKPPADPGAAQTRAKSPAPERSRK